MESFSEKPPGQSAVLTYNFANALDLTLGETLQSPVTVTVLAVLNIDQDPQAIFNGAAQIDPTGTLVLVPVIGGLDGEDYEIRVNVATSNPQKNPEWPCVLPVRLYPQNGGGCQTCP